LHVFLEEGGFQ
jgi:hypothetical protein